MPMGPIVLGPDDKPLFAEPPAGFDVTRDGIPRGTLALVEYESKTVGTRRRMQVYTPPGYSKRRKYPVLYLLHGIGGDETEWQRFVAPNVMLDNLLAEKKTVPMIVVMPNGRAQPNDRAEGNIYQHAPAFARFERDLLDDVIPAIERGFSVRPGRDYRALAGLSMGGGQSLNFGLGHLDTFAWIGAFSPAPNTKPPAELLADPAAAARLKLLYLSCGNKDGLIRISQGVHAFLKEKSVPHIWHVDAHAHDTPEWKSNLYQFAQRVFQKRSAAFAGAAAAAPSAPEQWEPIFNGRNLDGWTVKLNHHATADNFGATFRAENGLIRVAYDQYPDFGERFGHLFYQKKLSHFRLRLEYRFFGEQIKGGPPYAKLNSGVMFHSQPPASILKDQNWPISVEAQFLAGGRTTMNVCTPGTEIHRDGQMIKAHCTNSTSKVYPNDAWVPIELEVLGGGRVRHYVDGQLVLEYEKSMIGGGVANGFDPAFKQDGTVLTEGYIGLQSESQPVEFRKVELLNLTGCMNPKAKNFKAYYVNRDDASCRMR